MVSLRRHLLVACILAGCANRETAPQVREAAELRRARAAVVMLELGEREDGRFVARARGSGTVVSTEGHVLTNHHVLASSRTGQLYEAFRLSVFESDEGPPRRLCTGTSASGLLAPDQDLALIRCDRSSEIDWSPVPLGDPRAALPSDGDALWLLGYVAEGALRVHAGRIAASPGADGFLRSTASVAHGMSGGSAIDDQGRLIAIPTGYRDLRRRAAGGRIPQGRQGLLIPIRAAAPLLDEAGLVRGQP